MWTNVDVKNEILRRVVYSEYPVTLKGLETFLRMEFGYDRKIIRDTIRKLVNLGDLEYSIVNGSSCLETSFCRPVRISSHVIVKPEEMGFDGAMSEVVIGMSKGVSFGSGRHPTTSLCIRAIDFTMSSNHHLQGGVGLDIGTGSGILSLVAVKMGLSRIEAIDIDESARCEAKRNAKINGLSSLINVSDVPLEKIDGKFHIVIANLRFPTLITMRPKMTDVALPGAFYIFSGFREEEASKLYAHYFAYGIELVESFSERAWCSCILKKIDSIPI